MQRRNYYAVLGVSPHESAAGIRAAYQALALGLHPEAAGTGAAFQDISSAYRVLSDSASRETYDEERSGEVFRTALPPPEPIRQTPVSLFAQPDQTLPSFQEFFDRYLRNFTGYHVPKAEQPESLTLDVQLSPLEAFRGCYIPVGVPVFRICPECAGSGSNPPFRCAECGGTGKIEEEREIRIQVPAGVRPGAIFESPLDLFGIANLYLRVHVSISDQ